MLTKTLNDYSTGCANEQVRAGVTSFAMPYAENCPCADSRTSAAAYYPLLRPAGT